MRQRPFLNEMLLPLCLLALHACIALNAARRLSPVWDEVVYPAAGYSYWQTGTLWMNTEHPPLSKLLIALPYAILAPELSTTNSEWLARDGYRYGYDFFNNNRVPAQTLIFWSRIPGILFSVLTGLVLFGWSKSIWGQTGGLLSLFVYLCSPVFLSRASLALLEMPMYFFMSLSLYLYDRFLRNGNWRWAAVCGTALGLALTCKLTAISLIPTYVILTLYSPHKKSADLLSRWKGLVVILSAAAAAGLLVFLPWTNSLSAIKDVMLNVKGFTSRIPFNFHQREYTGGPLLLTWAGVLLKTPLPIIVLAAWGAHAWHRTEQSRLPLLQATALIGVCLLLPWAGGAVSTIQVSPLHLGLVVLAGGLAHVVNRGALWQKSCLGSLLVIAGTGVAIAHPNYIGYFNVLAGGTPQGYRWLADSDQDWGQGLPRLAEYLQKAPRADLLLCYSGAGNPQRYGIAYQDLFSPALVARSYRGDRLTALTGPLRLAIGTKVVQSQQGIFGWLIEQRRPVKNVDGLFFIYDITNDREAMRWIADIYAQTRRPIEAEWALQRLENIR